MYLEGTYGRGDPPQAADTRVGGSAARQERRTNCGTGGCMTIRTTKVIALAPIAFLVACSESRDLPSAPSIPAERAAAERWAKMRWRICATCMAWGLLLIALVSGCATEPTVTEPSTEISVAVTPATVSVVTGGSQVFHATVANDPGSKGVSWSISGCTGSASVCGSLTELTGTTVTYTAPGAVPPGTLGVTATSVADDSKSYTAVVAVGTPRPCLRCCAIASCAGAAGPKLPSPETGQAG